MVLTILDFWLPLAWGLVMLAGWLGWGHVVRRCLGLGSRGGERRVDWGLLAGWGMVAELIAGGFFQWGKICNQEMLAAIAMIGAGIWALHLYLHPAPPDEMNRRHESLRPMHWLPYFPAVLLLAFFYVTSVQTLRADPWDDFASYFVMDKRLMQTGIILDPYGVRRLLTYGGQPMFDAMLLARAGFLNIDILELGLSKIVFAGLLAGMMPARTMPQRLAAGGLLTLLLMVPVPAVNTNSAMTGVVLLIVLVRTFELRALRRWPMRQAVMIGLAGAALATMRMTFVPLSLLAIGLTYATGALQQRSKWKAHGYRLCLTCGVFVAGLLPWSLVLFESSGSFLYPLMRGTQRPDYDYIYAGLTFRESLSWVGGLLAHWQVLALLVPLSLAFGRRLRRVELPVYVAAIVATGLTLFTYTLTEQDNLYRFIFPALFAVTAVTLFRANMQAGGWWWNALICATGVLLLVASDRHLQPLGNSSIQVMRDDRLAVWTQAWRSPMLDALAHEPLYLTAQSKVPAGQPIFAAVTWPALLDFVRNRIDAVDMVGGASPEPGMPLLKGPDAIKAYLKDRGIEYVMFTPPDKDVAHVSRAVWSRAAAHPEKETPAFRRVYQFNLALIDALDAWDRTEEPVYSDDVLRVVRLK